MAEIEGHNTHFYSAAGATLKISYTYDAADRLTAITYPSDRVVHYTHATNGQVSALTTTSGGISPRRAQ